MTEYSEEEKQIVQYQLGFAERLRKSPYYIVEKTKSMGTSMAMVYGVVSKEC